MPGGITFLKTNDGYTIIIGNRIRTGVKALFYIQFIVYFITALSYFIIVFDETSLPIVVLTIAMAIVSLFVAYKYIGRSTEREIISIDNKTLTITHKKITGKETNVYELSLISHFTYEKAPTYTDHPLGGKSFDYLGFQARDRELQQVNDEGRISFSYEGKTIRFAKMLPSWDAEELGEKIKEVSGHHLLVEELHEKEESID